MSPRDRKRDRVLKRRRETKKKERHDDNEDALEQAYYTAREERVSKKIKTFDSNDKDTRVDTSSTCTTDDSLTKLNNVVGAPSSSSSSSSMSALTKEERQRLKNQQRKAMRKEKKARKQQMAQTILENKKQQEAKIQALKEKQNKKDQPKSAVSSQGFESMRLGVQYKDIIFGKGPSAQDRKKIRVSYKLRAQHCHGKIIDSSPDFRFRLGKGEVVKGWDIGLEGMKQGGVRHLIVPPQAGYGRRNVGAGSGGLLYFEITLVSC